MFPHEYQKLQTDLLSTHLWIIIGQLRLKSVFAFQNDNFLWNWLTNRKSQDLIIPNQSITMTNQNDTCILRPELNIKEFVGCVVERYVNSDWWGNWSAVRFSKWCMNTQSLMSWKLRLRVQSVFIVSNTHRVFVHLKPNYIMIPITFRDLKAVMKDINVVYSFQL